MRHYRQIALIITVLLTCVGSYKAQITNINLKAYTIQDGLSLSHLNCLYQDSEGFIWIGTQDGLNKFDGYTFKIYRHEPLDSTSMSSNNIQDITEDRNGDLWISTQYGLNRYDRDKDEFINYFAQLDNPASVVDNNLYALHVDKNNVLWIKSLNGINSMNISTESFFYYEHYLDRFNFITSYNHLDIEEDKKNRLWIASKDGLFVFDKATEHFQRFYYDSNNPGSLSHNEVRDIYIDSEDNIWIATNLGLNRYYPDKRSFKHYYFERKRVAVDENFVNDIIEDANGNIWVATAGGLMIVDESGLVPAYKHNKELAVFREVHVSDLILDNSNIMWVATRGDNLYKVNIKEKKFNLCNNKIEHCAGLSSNDIRSIMIDSRNQLWIGSANNGLNIINRKTNQITSYTANNSENYIPDNFVQAIFEDNEKRIWVGTQNGIFIYSPNSRKFENFTSLFNLRFADIFRNNRIYQIMQDSKGNMWFASQHGLFKYDNYRMIGFFNQVGDSTSLSYNEVYCVMEATDSTIWAGTLVGLNRMIDESGNFKQYYRADGKNKGLSNNSVLSLYQCENGNIWVGTESGLNRYNPEDDSFTFYTQRDGFKNDYIYAILSDNKENLWLSTNIGLVRFNPHTEEVYNYDLADGLQWYEFNLGASFQSRDGELFFGGGNGFNHFYPDSIKRNTYVPKALITRIIKHSSRGETDIYQHGVDEYKISYRDSKLTFEFSVLEFTHPTKNQYRYRMKGLDNDWVDLHNNNSVTFTQLAPGEYIFEVMGANSDLVWNQNTARVRILVKAGIWNNNLAYFLYIVVGLGVIYLLILYITHSLRKDNQLLKEKEKNALKIERQKEELTIKNKNILDSMNYAQRIIEAMMPTIGEFGQILPHSFIVYKPKDIVSGDFYWIVQKNNKVFVAAVDCTGHGIPGAFMSIIGFDLLRDIVGVRGIVEPDKILNALSHGVVETFTKNGSEDTVSDGMDLALCVIDKDNKQLHYAGAYNPLYLIRDDNIVEFKGDRFSVGSAGIATGHKFTTHTIDLEQEDVIYLFSDGFTDQFGGPDGKKFKFRRFRHLLLTIHRHHMQTQRDALVRSIENWRGDLEQVDDILVIGIRPLVIETGS